jgi:outer membrane protein assembly complex protein YaeT
MLPSLVLAVAIAVGQEAVRGASESYRGLIVKEIRLDHPGGPPPEASRELIEVLPGEPYRPEAVRRSIQQLFSLGVFSDIKVEAYPAGDPPSEPRQVVVVFRLFPRLEVAAVELEGLEVEPGLDDLRDSLLEESQIREGDAFDVEGLSAAAARLASFLRAEGYLWAKVDPEAAFQSPTARVVFHVEPGARARLGTLAIDGVPAHIEAHIRKELALVEGGPYSRRDLDRKLQSLSEEWKDLGYYGARVSLSESEASGQRVDVLLLPSMGPKVRVEVTGWDFSDKELRKLVPLFTEARFTEDLVEESRGNLEERLKEDGHRDAAVSVERETVGEDEQLVLRFLVEPGPRFEVQAVEIQGLEAAYEAEVRGLLVTRANHGVRSAPFRQKTWEADLDAVRTYLESRGFHRARVDASEHLDPEAEGRVTLVLRVEEGPRALVDRVELQGAEALEAASVLDAALLGPGEPFAASEVVAARERVLTLYRNQGFRGVEVETRSVLDDRGESAVVTFVVREGERTRVDRVILAGLRVTKESAVRRLVSIEPGEPLSPLAIAETRQSLVGSGLFRSVDIEPLAADPETLRSDVLITLVEGPRTTFAYGFGYEERQLARAEVEVTRRNLFGLNRSVSVFTRASFRGARFITTYRQPEFFSAQLPVFVSFFAEEEDRTSFDYNRVGIGLQFSKRLSPDQNLFFRYRYDRTKVFQLEVDIEEIDRRFRNTRISALSMASVTDRRDDPLNPRRGQFRILDAEWSAEALGTEAPYLKGLAQQFFYLRLPRDLVAAVGMRLGVGQTYREDRDALLPIAERFFVGGATTLRGFALDEASPKRKIPLPNGEVVDGEPIGGNVLALLNVELRFPILGNLRGVVFSDNGNVYRRLQVIELLNWRYNAGFGFRYDTPLGPLRVDYGFKLDRRTVRSIECPDVLVPCKESLGRWHVSLGHAF